jgi:type I restriction enzyme M protein
LLVVHEHASRSAGSLTPDERAHLRDGFVRGYELVDGTARPAAMNLLLHGIGKPNGASLIEVKDALLADPGTRWSVVLSNPPFGRKSSITTVGADGREAREDREIERPDFAVTTANKQLNFVQHIARSSASPAAPPSSFRTTSCSRVASARPCTVACSPTSTSTRWCACRPESSTPRA